MKDLIDQLHQFRDARNWQKHHTPAELARALMIEGAELNRLFMWGKEPRLDEIKEEVADNLIYCLYICDHYGLDPEQIIREKIALNGEKYPVDFDAKKAGWR